LKERLRMATPEELKKAAVAQEKAKEKADKPLPALKSPTVNLLDEIRGIIAVWCKESGISFAVQSQVLWIDFLAGIGKIKKDQVEALKLAATTAKKGGGGGKLKAENEDLKGDREASGTAGEVAGKEVTVRYSTVS
jgi:hypothetical protein